MLEQGDHLGMARSYGMFQGDATGRHVRRGTVARGNTRAKRHSTKGTTSARPHKPGVLGGLAAAGSDRISGVLGALRGGNLQAALAQGILGTGKSLAGGGGKRRSMNMANIKALKRGLRRVEGFEKIVKRVYKAYPRMQRAHAHQAPHHFGRKHKVK
jgi:hypothetical protein